MTNFVFKKYGFVDGQYVETRGYVSAESLMGAMDALHHHLENHPDDGERSLYAETDGLSVAWVSTTKWDYDFDEECADDVFGLENFVQKTA